jgi:hypothetical protein
LLLDTLQRIMPGIVNKGCVWQLFDVSTPRPPSDSFYLSEQAEIANLRSTRASRP